MRRRIIVISAIGIVAWGPMFWKGRAQPLALPDFSGQWELISSTGTTPPAGFRMQLNQSSIALQVRTHWTEPENRQYGLTLAGLLTPELTFSLEGRQDVNQARPFVITSKTRWNGARLITIWSTSEFMGASFQGQWMHSLSADGHELRLEIQASSSQGRHSDAVLNFRKK